MADTRVLQNGTDVRVLQNGTDVRVTETSLNFYTMTADAGAIVETGTAATLREAKVLVAATASASTTGTAATLRFGHKLVATIRFYTTTGLLSILGQSTVMFGAAGSLAETGIAAALRTTRKLAAGLPLVPPAGFSGEALSQAEIQLTWRAPESINVDMSATVTRGRTLIASSGSVTQTGINARIVRNPPALIAEGVLSPPVNFAGIPGSTSVALSWQAAPSVVVDGVSPLFRRTRIFSVASGSVAETGVAATLTHHSLNFYTLPASAGSVATSGLSVGLTEQERINPASGSIISTGLSANLTYSQKIHFSAASGAISLDGINAGLVHTEVGEYIITAEVGAMLASAPAATFKLARVLAASSTGIVATGIPVGIGRRLSVSVSAGSLNTSGIDAGMSRTKGIRGSIGAINATGISAALLAIADDYIPTPPFTLYLASGETYLYTETGETKIYLTSGETFIRLEQ